MLWSGDDLAFRCNVRAVLWSDKQLIFSLDRYSVLFSLKSWALHCSVSLMNTIFASCCSG